MPRIGMKNLRYSVVKVSTNEQGVETETYSPVKKLARVVSDNASINLDKTKFYCNDTTGEYEPAFIDGTLSAVVAEMTNENIADVNGLTVTEGGDLEFGADDSSVYLRVGHTITIIQEGTRYYQGIIYNRVKFDPIYSTGNQTKGERIQYTPTNLNGEIMQDAQGKWHMVSAWKETEAAALTWLDAHLAPSGT